MVWIKHEKALTGTVQEVAGAELDIMPTGVKLTVLR
jgi:hypothetical protein